MNEESANSDALLGCTNNVLNDIELKNILISAQQVNFILNIEFAVR